VEKIVEQPANNPNNRLAGRGFDKFIIKVPMAAYVRCLAKCGEKSPEYALLRNGVVLNDGKRKEMLHIRCDAEKAEVIRSILARECPEFLDGVHVYPDPA